MTSYIPETYYGAIQDANRRWTGQSGLVPWPAHLQPREPEPLPDVDLKSLFGESPGIELTKKGEAYAEKVIAEAGGVFFLTLSKDDRAGIAYTIERLINLLDAMEPDPDLEPYLAGSDGPPTDDREGDLDLEEGADSWKDEDLEYSGDEHAASWPEEVNARRSGSIYEDDEPTLGAAERHPSNSWGRENKQERKDHSQEFWAASDAYHDDCEDEDDREIVSEDEGAITGDDEYSLGWEAEGSQEHLNMTDWEADLATTEEIDQVRRLEVSDGWQVQDSEPDLGWAESFGKGIVGPQNCLDDREHEDEREWDPAEQGIADADAMASEEFCFNQPSAFPREHYKPTGIDFRGDGIREARNLLRKANGQPPLVEKATKLPDQTVVRQFEPVRQVDDDFDRMAPEIDPAKWCAMHYRAAHERPQ